MNFTKEFKEFITTLDKFERECVMFCVVENPECSIDTFLFLLDSMHKNMLYRKAFTHNYIHSITKDYSLKAFTINEANYLREKLKTLDGTLLTDIISRTLITHKIFI